MNYQQIGPTVFSFTADGETFTIPVQKEFPHSFIGVVFCDANGVLASAPAGLKVKITGETVNTPSFFQELAESVIDLTAPSTSSADANLTKLRFLMQGVTAAGHIKITITQNLS